MRVIIAGSRDITDIRLVMDLIDASYFDITTVISGCARGVDTSALMKPWACPVRRVPVTSADWEKWGKSAGYRRNTLMMLEADALIAVWDGKSPGTEHMIRIMRMAGKPVDMTIIGCGFGWGIHLNHRELKIILMVRENEEAIKHPTTRRRQGDAPALPALGYADVRTLINKGLVELRTDSAGKRTPSLTMRGKSIIKQIDMDASDVFRRTEEMVA